MLIETRNIRKLAKAVLGALDGPVPRGDLDLAAVRLLALAVLEATPAALSVSLANRLALKAVRDSFPPRKESVLDHLDVADDQA